MIEQRTAVKASGFRGANTDRWWTKDSKYGVRYQCSSCGKIILGLYDNGQDSRHHYSGCVRLAVAETREETRPTPTRPEIALEDRRSRGEVSCNTCGLQDDTVRSLFFRWRDSGAAGQSMGGGIGVTLCAGCRARTVSVLAADAGRVEGGA
jgi:hypothetical protein